MNDLNEDQRKALKAFKKKLKATQLDEDSKLGRSPLSGSGHQRITAIEPPTGFGRTVWEELAAKGYLRRDGGWFFELVQWKAEGGTSSTPS
jgi:hypothetical protein